MDSKCLGPEVAHAVEYHVGQRVEFKDKNEERWSAGRVSDWRQGEVISIDPLQVKPDYIKTGFTWDSVRAIEVRPDYLAQEVR